MAETEPGAKPRDDFVPNGWLSWFLKAGRFEAALAYLGGALEGFADTRKPTQEQRAVALNAAETVRRFFEDREACATVDAKTACDRDHAKDAAFYGWEYCPVCGTHIKQAQAANREA